MSYAKPTRRSGVYLLSKEATRELTDRLPGENKVEFVAVIDSEGQVDFYIPNKKIGDNVVQIDTCSGSCLLHQVSTEDPDQDENHFIVKGGFTNREVPCDADIVKKMEGGTVKALFSVAGAIYHNSGCACSSGSCIHR